ncbi:MAG: GGDEF domain-containing response regulator [Wenzhouxiangella sp.]
MFDAERLKQIQAREESQRSSRRHRVLVVDDEPANLQAIEAILAADYEVMTAPGAHEALALIDIPSNTERLAVVISDYRMPNTDGVTLFAALAERVPRARRILLTGYVDIDAVIDSINRARIWRFLIKPYDREDLRLTVHRAVEAWDLQQQLDDHVNNLERQVADRTRELEIRNQELKEAMAIIHQASRTDSLTGLRNRRYLEDTIEADIALARRRRNEPESDLVFFMIDLDQFKPVNDIHGHAAGDQVLIETARRLQTCARSADVVMRWGGEEFLLLARFIDHHEADAIGQRLCQAIADQPFLLNDDSTVRLSASVGYASWPQPDLPDGGHWTDLIERADQAMYAAKRAGGNRLVVAGQ